jgi:phosphoglycerol transferase MdoB-like AlkP superfamily enzyme
MQKIPSFIKTLIKLFIVHLFLFFIVRLAFVISNLALIKGNDLPTNFVLQSFLMGLRFDVSVLCYIFSIPFLFLFIDELVMADLLRKVSIIYLKIILPLTLFISCADIPYYIQFQKHLSKEAFVWIKQGTLSLKLIISDFSYWGYLLLALPIIYLSLKSITYCFKEKYVFNSEKKHSLILFIVFGFFLFIGARGRSSGKMPIHIGLAYISDNMLINQTGLNANFTLFKSFLGDNENKSFLHSTNDAKIICQAKKLLHFTDTISNTLFVRHIEKTDSCKKLNVVVVLMESMCATKMGAYGQKSLTPNLIQLSKQSMYFSDFYSAGIHTYNGIFSTLTGFPALLHEHSLEKYIDKKFNCLPSNLKKEGYQTMFFTTHDEQFDNMAGFLKYNDVNQIFSEKDFPGDQSISTLGVPDHVMFDFAIEKLNKQQQPFFAMMLTSSDHGPWEIPTNIPFKPNGIDEKERATQYADWSINHFIENAKKEKWFDNTLFVFLGDHGVSFGHTYQMPLSFHHVPCVFYAPNFIKPQINNSLSGQIDVFPTIMGILGFAYDNHSFGIDLLKEKRDCIYFSADNKVGCLNNTCYYFNLLDAKQNILYEYKNLSDKNQLVNRRTTADSLEMYMSTMFKAANCLISNNKY